RTALYDALVAGLDRLNQATRPRKVLIVISDGGDNASTTKLDAVLARARQSNVTIYTLGLFDANDRDTNPALPNKLAYTTGAALAVWCAIAIIEARYYSRLPVPPAKEAAAVATLPGDAPAPARPRPAPAVGTWVARIEAPSVGLSSTVLEGSDDATLARAAGH